METAQQHFQLSPVFTWMLMKMFAVSDSLYEKIYSLNICGQEFTNKESKIGS